MTPNTTKVVNESRDDKVTPEEANFSLGICILLAVEGVSIYLDNPGSPIQRIVAQQQKRQEPEQGARSHGDMHRRVAHQSVLRLPHLVLQARNLWRGDPPRHYQLIAKPDHRDRTRRLL